VAIAIKDRDLRNIGIRDNTEKEAGARVHAEIIDQIKISNRIISPGMSHSDIEGNSHQLEERGTTGRITIRIIKGISDIMNPIELLKNLKIREEAQIITIIPNGLLKTKEDIVDHALAETVYRKTTMVPRKFHPRRAMTPLSLPAQ
jgi:hypothetical protein